VPAFDCVVREREVRLAQDEVGANEVVRGTHGKNTNNHEPSCNPRHPSCDLGGCKHRDPRVLSTSKGIR